MVQIVQKNRDLVTPPAIQLRSVVIRWCCSIRAFEAAEKGVESLVAPLVALRLTMGANGF